MFDTDGKQSVDKKAKIICGANHCDPDDDFKTKGTENSCVVNLLL